MIDEIKQAVSAGKRPALSYDRVSTKEQASGMSLEYQASRSLEYAAGVGLAIVKQFNSAESGRKEGRKNFNAMLDSAVSYGVPDIIVKNIDRLGRNSADWARVKKLVREGRITVHLYELGMVFHRDSTAEDEMVLDQIAGMAVYWGNKISQGARHAYKYKVQRGIAPCQHAPFGYRYDRERKTFVIDEGARQFVEYIMDTYDRGGIGTQDLARHMNDRGVKTARGNSWTDSSIERILKSPFYAGKFTHRGELHTGTHAAYIAPERLEKRLAVMRDRHRAKKGRAYALKGLVRNIETGRLLSGVFQRGAHDSGEYVYYVHNEPHYFSVREDAVLSALGALIDNMRFDDAFAEYLEDLFRAGVSEYARRHSGERQTAAKRIRAIEREQQRLLDLLVQGVDAPAVRERMRANREAIERIERENAAERVDAERLVFTISETIENIRNLAQIFSGASAEHRGALIRAMAEVVTVRKNEDGDLSVAVSWKKPFCYIIDSVQLADVMGPQRAEFVTRAVACFHSYLSAA